jgi:hypothetical protein
MCYHTMPIVPPFDSCPADNAHSFGNSARDAISPSNIGSHFIYLMQGALLHHHLPRERKNLSK